MYKSRLQELCQKKSWNLPEYSSTKEGPPHNSRFRATVSVNGRLFRNPSRATCVKDAQNDAARAAFDYFSSPSYSTPAASASVPAMPGRIGESTTVRASDTNGKPKIDYEGLSKSLLQSYAQKKSLDPPCYSCKRIGPPHMTSFRGKVTVGGKTYESREFLGTLSKAENAAAKVALMSLAPEGIEEDKHAYKSLLQELCQKEFNKLPAYSITFSGEAHNPTFISVVEVGGEVFSGLEAKSKKKAEFNAAKVAYIALQQRNSKPSPLISSSAISNDLSSTNWTSSLGCDSSNPIAPTQSSPCRRQSVVQETSSSRPAFTDFLQKNAPIEPELPCSKEAPQEVKASLKWLMENMEATQASDKAKDRVVEATSDVASPSQSSCPPSGSSILSGAVISSLPFDSSNNSAVIATAQHYFMCPK